MGGNLKTYGMKKRGSSKVHSHNKCGVCSERNISKKAERFQAKRMITAETTEDATQNSLGGEQANDSKVEASDKCGHKTESWLRI